MPLSNIINRLFARNNVVLDKNVLLNPMRYLAKEKVYLEKLNGYVWVRELKAIEQMKYNQRIESVKDIDSMKSLEFICLMVSMGVCDADGNPLYTEDESKALADNSLTTVLKLHQAIIKLNNQGSIIKKLNK